MYNSVGLSGRFYFEELACSKLHSKIDLSFLSSGMGRLPKLAKPMASNECQIMIIEPKGVINTGNKMDSELKSDNDVWV